MTSAAVAAVALAAACGAVLPRPAHGRLLRVVSPPHDRSVPPAARRTSRTGPSPSSAGTLVAAAVLAVALVGVAPVVGAMPGALVVGGLAAAGRWWRVRSRRVAATHDRARVVELCAALAAELRSGAAPRDALAWAASGWPAAEPFVPAIRAGHADVPDLLTDLAARPGAEGLRALAVCWLVSDRSGSALAPAVTRLADTLRDEEQVRREVAAQLAGPRSTAALLALLPVMGLAMGAALGGDPVGLLIGTPVGLALLAAGALLEAAGLAWTARIARAATPG